MRSYVDARTGALLFWKEDIMKIGEVVKKVLVPLLLSGKVSEDEIQKLNDEDYCRSTFGLYLPMLIKSNGNTIYRYYSPKTTTLCIYGTDYLLTNDWYEDNNRHQLQPLLDWIKKYDSVISNSEIENIENIKIIEGKEKEVLIKQRVNQSKIRQSALTKYGTKCCLCGVTQKELLVVSHIKSWSDSTSSEKGNIDNVLIMCPNHDSLFDKHLISFESNGKILINKRLDDINKTMLNINSEMKLGLIFSEDMKRFLEYHRTIFESKNT